MGHFWKSSKLNTFILSCTFSIFTLSAVIPAYAIPQSGINLNDIGFAMRIEKLVEKLNKYKERRDSSKLIEVMLDIKSEVEGYTGHKISIEKSLDQVERDVKARGGSVDKKVMSKLKKEFRYYEKRSNYKASYMASCLEFDLPYDADEERTLFQRELQMAKHGHEKDKDDEINIPIRVTIGVTITLCGVFLLFVPIPVCKQYAPYIIETGLAFLVDEGITQMEEKNKTKSTN